MRMYPILRLVIGLALSACGDPGGLPPEPSLETTGARVTVRTTGPAINIDQDGYRVVVDGSDRGAIPANGTKVMPLDPEAGRLR